MRDGTTPLATKVSLVAVLCLTGAVLAFFVLGPVDTGDPRAVAPFLWLFAGLFLVRVLGQVLVAVMAPRWLPPMDGWNLTPYRLLLPSQVVILAAMAWLGVSFSGVDGVPVGARLPGAVLLALAVAYAAAMAVRYAVRMRRRPRERWFGGTIPIVFHIVLASYLFVLGTFHGA